MLSNVYELLIWNRCFISDDNLMKLLFQNQLFKFFKWSRFEVSESAFKTAFKWTHSVVYSSFNLIEIRLICLHFFCMIFFHLFIYHFIRSFYSCRCLQLDSIDIYQSCQDLIEFWFCHDIDWIVVFIDSLNLNNFSSFIELTKTHEIDH